MAVGSDAWFKGMKSGIVDQHVDPGMTRDDLASQCCDRGQIGEITIVHVDPCARRGSLDHRYRCIGLGLAARGEHEIRSLPGECKRHPPTAPTVSSGYHNPRTSSPNTRSFY